MTEPRLYRDLAPWWPVLSAPADSREVFMGTRPASGS